MQVGLAQCVNKGMQRDYSMDKASQEFAYENRNIRITTTGNESFLSVTNEKGTIKLTDRTWIPYLLTDENKTIYVSNMVKASFKAKITFEGGITESHILKSGDNRFSVKILNVESEDLEVNLFKSGTQKPDSSIKGAVIGNATIDDYLVLFTTDSLNDYIYRITINDTKFSIVTLYEGDLQFSTDNPIECITSYEGDEVLKVYWVDGKNQPRYINIVTKEKYPEDTHFEFKPSIPSNLNVQIDKEHNGTGKFKSGVVQYFITAYKKFGAETNLLYQSPLYYISPNNRGGNINEDQTCNFRITVNLDSNEFSSIKVYSIVRTSLNVPQGFLVGDVELQNNTGIIIDNGDNIPIDATDILFLNDSTIIPSTIEVKDETLFLGNVKTKYSSLEEDIKDLLKPEQQNIQINFGKKILSVPKQKEDNIYYSYEPQLLSSEYSTTFKYREWYRIGIQFQSDTLEWTSSYYIGDFQNNVSPTLNDDTELVCYKNFTDEEEPENTVNGTMVYATLSETLVNTLTEKGYKSWRLTMVPHTSGTRTIKAQGLVLPTVYNLYNKYSEIDTGSPIWSLDMCHKAMHNTNIVPSTSTVTESMQVDSHDNLMREHVFSRTHYKSSNSKYATLNNTEVSSVKTNTFTEDYYIYSITPKFKIDREIAGWMAIASRDYYEAGIIITVYDSKNNTTHSFDLGQFKKDSRLLGQRDKACKDISSWFKTVFWSTYKSKTITINDDIIKVSDLGGYNPNSKIFKSGEIPSGGKLRDKISVTKDHTIKLTPCLRNVTFDWKKEFVNTYKNDYFIDAHLCNFLSPDIDNVNEDLMFRVVGSVKLNNTLSDYKITVENPVVGGTLYKQGIWNFNDNNINGFVSGLTTFPLWHYNNKLYNIYYWHSAGPLVYAGTDNKTEYFKLTSKKVANMWYFSETSYFETPCEFPDENDKSKITDLEISDNTSYINNNIFKFDYENLLICTPETKTFLLRNDTNINETETLDNINKYIDNNDYSLATNNTTNVPITFKSSKQAVFELPSTKYQPYVLPNYGNNIDAEQSLFGGTLSHFLTVDEFVLIDNSYADAKYPDTPSYIEEYTNARWKQYNDGRIEITYFDGNNRIGITQFKASSSNTRIFYYTGTTAKELAKLKTSPNDEELETKNKYLIILDDCFVYCRGIKRITKATVEYTIDTVYVTPKDFIFSYLKKGESKIKYIQGNPQSLIAFYLYDSRSHISPQIESDSKFLIGEFYTQYSEDTFMGGNSDNVLETQTFIPIGGKYSFEIEELGEPENEDKIKCSLGYGLEGDTYYQRWDHVRIYPKTKNDVNQNTDAFSMMVETYQNLDADYRELRGRLDTTTLTVNNTNNVLNPVYNQTNNYITSSVLDKKYEDSTHPTLYTWSLTKQAMSDIDTWTSINLSRSAKLDGDKGVLTKIKRWNNQLLAFQEKGLAVINFNQQTTISTDAGVPVEIAASGLVSGHYYISSTQGCKNKWSIADSPYGIYFIDSYNKSINVYGSEGIKSLSTINLFQDWILENEKGTIWKPAVNNDGFKSFYDPIHKEIYFVNNKEALCYNELLTQFTSFYDYGRLCTMATINGNIYGIKHITDTNGKVEIASTLHKMFSDDTNYCKLFDINYPYSITYKINKDPFIDKTWTNIEYRSDIFNSGNVGNANSNRNIPLETFDTLEVWNEYQKGVLSLANKAKCKFRIWRSDIPRDTEATINREKLNRIRNPWIMLRLTKNADSSNKRLEFHDLLIKYLQ